jgi:hypothetical protein
MKRKHLQTDFVKFILEKYSREGQDLPEGEEIENPDDENEEPEFRKRKGIKKLNEFDDEDEIEEDDEESNEVDDELIDELLNEYKRLKKKYESNKLSYRRKR